MSNKWGISKEVEEFVRQRDLSCVYCGIEFAKSNESKKLSPSWEHIINNIKINGVENIALCCHSCNSSKGSKILKDWLSSNYCKNKGINASNVALIVKEHLI